MVAMARAVSLSPKEDSCDLEMKSDEEDRDSEIDRRARVNAEGGQREVTESVPRSAPSDKLSRRKCGIIRGTLDGRVRCHEMLWLNLEGRVRPHDRLLLHQAEMQDPGQPVWSGLLVCIEQAIATIG